MVFDAIWYLALRVLDLCESLAILLNDERPEIDCNVGAILECANETIICESERDGLLSPVDRMPAVLEIVAPGSLTLASALRHLDRIDVTAFRTAN